MKALERDSILSQVGPGWSSILSRLMDDLNSLGWDGTVLQVKEKFGGLRFYIGSGSDDIYRRIDRAENESFETCEICGEPGRPREGGWIKTLCDNCEAKRRALLHG